MKRRPRAAGAAVLLVGVAIAAGAGTGADAGSSDSFEARLLAAARRQIGVTLRYDAYTRLAYPGGDVPIERGVCTDVVRAYREAGIDLQVLVHQDMAKGLPAYPKLWGLTRPDRNVDHRRVHNLGTFFSRHGRILAATTDPAAYAAGDLVTWRLPSGRPHIGIVSDRKTGAGVPLVVHNVGAGTVEEDVLFAYAVTGHFRYPADARD